MAIEARAPSGGGEACRMAGSRPRARRSSSARGARWAGRCRPSRSGRRPRSRPSACSGPGSRCGCRRTRGPRAATRWPSAGECRSRRHALAAGSTRHCGRRCRCPVRPRPAPTCPQARRRTVSRAWSRRAAGKRGWSWPNPPRQHERQTNRLSSEMSAGGSARARARVNNLTHPADV